MLALILRLTLLFLFLVLPNSVPGAENGWRYVLVDGARKKWDDFSPPAGLRYLGLAAADLNRDGQRDLVSGRYVYINPGGKMTSAWKRVDLGLNVDGVLATDIDGDEQADVIALALPQVFWCEAESIAASSWRFKPVATVTATEHVNSQGYRLADVVPEGRPEILIAGGAGISMIEAPDRPDRSTWRTTLIVPDASDEGFAAGDVDRDGDVDLVYARSMDTDEGNRPRSIVWWENPGNTGNHPRTHELHSSAHDIDRIELADLNGDGRLDVIYSEERHPGHEPDAMLVWLAAPPRPAGASWIAKTLLKQYSMNNLDAGDVDGDDDIDLVTSEHKGPHLRVQLLENDGSGNFETTDIDAGKEMHLGAQLFDLDADGDLDLVGHAWTEYARLHLWRNDRIEHEWRWRRVSSADGELPIPTAGRQQTALAVADFDRDGRPEAVVAERTAAPALSWIRPTAEGWTRFVIEPECLRVEAGSAVADIDRDGDLDLVFGGDSRSNQVWWWENPCPEYDPESPWTRRVIKASGGAKHHDQLFGDFDGDGDQELVFWNQGAGAGCLMLAEVPKDPRSHHGEWPFRVIYDYADTDEMQCLLGPAGYPVRPDTNEHEGLAAADIDDDGLVDIVGGGHWFKYTDGVFAPRVIDASYQFTRSAVGDLVERTPRPEVVLALGDGVGPLCLYEWGENGAWRRRLLMSEVNHGHSLEVVDVNHDGHQDIFLGEMSFDGDHSRSGIMFFLGDGRGNFRRELVASGIGTHEARTADLDGDGDLDIVSKPYAWKTPRLDLYYNENLLLSR